MERQEQIKQTTYPRKLGLSIKIEIKSYSRAMMSNLSKKYCLPPKNTIPNNKFIELFIFKIFKFDVKLMRVAWGANW